MPYIAPEVITEAKRMDLLTYLQNYEPHELVHFSGNTYCTRSHDSLKISNGKWFWWSRGIGGRSALDYLIKVRELSFTDAVEQIMGRAASTPPVFASPKEQKPKALLLPEPYPHTDEVECYLLRRGIDPALLQTCIADGRIYESRNEPEPGKVYINAVFVGFDAQGQKKYAALRGISGDFKGEAIGSDKHYSFALPALKPSDSVHLFESAVDLLSYTQLFQQLFHCADHKHGGSLPVHVHFVMDEFANVSLPDDFEKILSVMRSRNVSVSIILQNIAQLKALFEKQWESIMGNCDEFLYLGGNETSTHKLISESLLGKSTIDTNTYGKSTGRNGNYSTNYQITGRELLTPDEVRMLDNRYALLFVRGERPIMDEKYDILRHPHVSHTTDGGGEAYRHGEVTQAVASLAFVRPTGDMPRLEPLASGEITFELLSEEDMQALYQSKKQEA
ncbi:MAG TPA: TraM recognition domain-containing protein [Clostridia bacterium]|nr:TraM recognition domain-containing protein [Clostridia bacterium]